jgi:hypothetical protein
MEKKAVLVILMVLLISISAFSKQFERGYEYYIVNNSRENIKLTFLPNDLFSGQRDSERLYQDFNIGRFYFWEYIDEEIPNVNSEIGRTNFWGTYSWKHRPLIRRAFPIGYHIDNEDQFIFYNFVDDRYQGDSLVYFNHYGERYLEKNELRILAGDELFEWLVRHFLILDISGNIIMTFEDIYSGSFIEADLDLLVNGRPPDLWNNGINPGVWGSYILYITDEIIEYGRRKYLETAG